MIQFEKDLKDGKITNNKNIEGVRHNGKLEADWTENPNFICAEANYENY